MPTRNANFAAEAARRRQARSSAAALRTREQDEREYELKLDALRGAIAEGDASGIAQGDPFTRLRKKFKLPTSRR